MGTSAFNNIMSLANKTEGYVVHVVESFDNTSLTIQEMISSLEATKGDKENAKRQTERLIEQRNATKKAALIHLETITNRMEEKEKEAKIYEQKWFDAQKELKEATRRNSEAEPLYTTKETPIYEERNITVKVRGEKKKYSAYRNECKDECLGDDEKFCYTIQGKSEACSEDNEQDYRGY